MMEFEDDHEEEEEEEDDEDEEIAITPTFKKLHHQPPARYRECLKNHAVGMGGHAVDGCGEFLPAGADGTIDALRCAACNCHRNFHRKEVADLTSSSSSGQLTIYTTPRPHSHQMFQFYPYNRTTAGYLHVSGQGAQQQQQQRPLALPSPSAGPTFKGGGGGGGDNNNNHHHHNGGNEENVGVGGGVGGSGSGLSNNTTSSSGKKRFRTKFTAEQKDKMLELADKLGWRIQKQDEDAVHQFCLESGVKRHVLKVWMHNNKHTLGKKP